MLAPDGRWRIESPHVVPLFSYYRDKLADVSGGR